MATINSHSAYPLLFNTIYKEKVWGGKKIKTELGKDFGSLENCGETWEVSGVKGNISSIGNGPWEGENLSDVYQQLGPAMVGEKTFNTNPKTFPLLIKFIDAADDLSIQVHPDDFLGMKRHKSLGKTEMWYVMQADPGAKLISGFNRDLTKEEYLEYFNSGRLKEILNFVPVKEGDVFFLPAGRVHAIGGGIMLAEIQQTSDVTYRIYDWDRPDASGKMRDLHTEEALDAITFEKLEQANTPYETKKGEYTDLLKSPYFDTKLGLFTPDESAKDSTDEGKTCLIYICLEGECEIKANDFSQTVKRGQSLLVPACCLEAKVKASKATKLLKVRIPYE